ncbi:MAG TPA: nucleoside triphosphate pyrophosphohydrolase [Abditibacteriaceae bacterium]|jgi:tetrapyrrole methylase family protein/MazG family protein
MPNRPTPDAAFARLAEIIARLRAPDGCPWDREQTHLTLRKHLIEESYEVIDAIEHEDSDHLREELGDLLMQPVLHAQIAAEENRFDIVDVLEEISDKLVRRHPHVFGDVTADDSATVLKNWDAIKQQEKAAKSDSTTTDESSILSGVPRALPSLALAMEISKKAAKAGFEWPNVLAVMDKLREETQEVQSELESGADKQRVSEELGDLLFTVVNVARWQKIDPELALRDTVSRFTTRFEQMEAVAREQGRVLDALSSQEWDELWNAAKDAEAAASKKQQVN